MTLLNIDETDDSDWEPSTPVDPRARLSDAERAVTKTTLPNGTVLTDYTDPSLPPLLAADPDPLSHGDEGLSYRRHKPKPPNGDGRDRWARLK